MVADFNTCMCSIGRWKFMTSILFLIAGVVLRCEAVTTHLEAEEDWKTFSFNNYPSEYKRNTTGSTWLIQSDNTDDVISIVVNVIDHEERRRHSCNCSIHGNIEFYEEISLDIYDLKRSVVGSILLSGPSCSLGYFPFQPVVHNWLFKGRGSSPNSSMLRRICKSREKCFSSSTSSMFIKFQSDADMHGSGFEINYRSSSSKGSCGNHQSLWIVGVVICVAVVIVVFLIWSYCRTIQRRPECRVECARFISNLCSSTCFKFTGKCPFLDKIVRSLCIHTSARQDVVRSNTDFISIVPGCINYVPVHSSELSRTSRQAMYDVTHLSDEESEMSRTSGEAMHDVTHLSVEESEMSRTSCEAMYDVTHLSHEESEMSRTSREAMYDVTHLSDEEMINVISVKTTQDTTRVANREVNNFPLLTVVSHTQN